MPSCVSVCLSVTFVHFVEMSKHILKSLFTIGQTNHLLFFRWGLTNGGVECTGWAKNGLFSTSHNFATTDDRKACNMSKV